VEVRPYLVLGDSDRRFLLERIEAALAAWREDWLPGNAPELRPSPVSEPQAERWLAGETGGRRRVLLGCSGGWIAEVGALSTAQAPNAAAATGAAELAAQVGEAMLKGLAEGIFRYCSGTAPAKPHWGDEAPPETWLRPGAGAAIYSCELSPGFVLVLALSPELVAASLPKAQSAAREPLVAARRAVEPCAVIVEAVVGETEIELGELSQLAAGDVIVLDRKLDDPLLLRLDIGEPVGRIHLGTAGGKIAVQVVGPAST
jgi:flagellar motor switch/type III secretory pathway protein FliN